MKSICIFASGGGSHFKCIHDATLKKTLSASVVLLVSNNSECGAVEYAKKQNIPVFLTKDLNSDAENLLLELKNQNVSYLVLAGFVKKIPTKLTENFKNKIVNIHPSLLPKYGGKGMYGLNVHQAVLDNHEEYTGCTVHLVNEYYDEGDVLDQKKIKIPDEIKTSQMLSEYLKPIENKFYLNFLKSYLK